MSDIISTVKQELQTREFDARLDSLKDNTSKNDFYGLQGELVSHISEDMLDELREYALECVKQNNAPKQLTIKEQEYFNSLSQAITDGDSYGYVHTVIPAMQSVYGSEYNTVSSKLIKKMRLDNPRKAKDIDDFLSSVKRQSNEKYLEDNIGIISDSYGDMTSEFVKKFDIKINEKGFIETKYGYFLNNKKVTKSEIEDMEKNKDYRLVDLENKNKTSPAEFISREILRHFDKVGKRVDKNTLEVFSQEREYEINSELREKIRQKISFSEECENEITENKVWEEFIDLCFLPSNDSDKKAYIAVLKNFIYNVKCKMWGTYTAINVPIMPVIFNTNQGTGKSVLMKDFCNVIGEYFIASSNPQDVTNCKNHKLFEDNFITYFDEMAKMDKADMDSLKQRLTELSFDDRKLHSNLNKKVNINCMFIGTTNTCMRLLWKDVTGNRRALQMDFTDKKNFEERNVFLDKWLLKMWKSVDHTKTSYIKEHMAEIESIQSSSMAETPLEEFIKENLEDLQQKQRNSKTGSIIIDKAFSEEYREFCKNKFDKSATRLSAVDLYEQLQTLAPKIKAKEGISFTCKKPQKKYQIQFDLEEVLFEEPKQLSAADALKKLTANQ